MLIYSTNILAMLPMSVIWALEIYLVLTALRLIAGRLSADWARRTCLALQPITDPVPQAVGNWLSSRREAPVPGWVPWTLVVAAALLAQHALAALILKMS